MKHPQLFGKKVAVLGFGVEGVSVVSFLLGQRAHITVYDEKKPLETISAGFAAFRSAGVHYIYGSFPQLDGYDVIVFSPGIRPDILPLALARRAGMVVTTATNIFMDLVPCLTIGVTGTKGKGTTSSLIAEMLKADGRDAHLGGNIGTPPLDFLYNLTPESIVVLELSSFQTFTMTKSPKIALFIMTTSEHLDFHTNTEEYIAAKLNLVKHQNRNGEVIANIDYPNSKKLGVLSHKNYWEVSTHRMVKRGTFIKEGAFYWTDGKIIERIAPTSSMFIPGRHNWENAAAAIAVAKLMGVKNDMIVRTLEKFQGLPHRIEFVREFQGVTFFDDSFSTTPETAIAAIRAFDQPKVLILGGSSKNSDFTELGQVISESNSIRAIIGIGLEWERIKFQMPNAKCQIIEDCKNMKEIVEVASGVAQEGDVVLLSPACASFDMFKNYKDRGELFKRFVMELNN